MFQPSALSFPVNRLETLKILINDPPPVLTGRIQFLQEHQTDIITCMTELYVV